MRPQSRVQGHYPAPLRQAPTGDARQVSGSDIVAGVFRNMRAMLGRSQFDVAAVLGTTPAVVRAFEDGELHALPPWPETERIVLTFGHLLAVDVRPVLMHLKQQPIFTNGQRSLAAPVPQPRDAAPRPARPNPVAHRPPINATHRQIRAKRRAKRVFIAASAPLAVILASSWFLVSQPQAVQAAVGTLPAPLARTIRSGIERVVLALAPRREGLIWIEAFEPRSRKADKLPSRAQ